MDIITPPPRPKKSVAVYSWLGFGIAATLLMLIWLVNILIFHWAGNPAHSIAALYMSVIVLYSILGILAMAFSVVGLSMAVRNNAPKWIGVTGIAICVLSLISFFVPIMWAGMTKEKTPETNTVKTEPVRVSEIKEDVTIQVFMLGVRCINNTNPNGSVIGNMRTSDYDFKEQFSDWLKMNNVNSSTGIVINSSKNADYSDISQVVEALQENGITNYRLKNTLSDSDYL